MEIIKEIFMRVFSRAIDFGDLKRVDYSPNGFARIQIEKDGKIYTFSMYCEDKPDGNN